MSSQQRPSVSWSCDNLCFSSGEFITIHGNGPWEGVCPVSCSVHPITKQMINNYLTNGQTAFNLIPSCQPCPQQDHTLYHGQNGGLRRQVCPPTPLAWIPRDISAALLPRGPVTVTVSPEPPAPGVPTRLGGPSPHASARRFAAGLWKLNFQVILCRLAPPVLMLCSSHWGWLVPDAF